jgi:hypothetical protein
MKKLIFLVSFTLSSLASSVVYSQQNYQSDTQQEQQLSEAELAQMLAPIALYPDSLLTHILISSTYPLEVIEAHRWLQKNNTLNTTQLAQSMDNFDWDPSVKALVPFEQILNRLSEDLSWMQQLGNAFLEDETRVLVSIQTLREQAKISGNLSKMNNMEVSYEDNNIVIEPIEKEVVYVPYYDTRMVYGTWHWSSFPPVYWRPTDRVHVNRHNPFYWHSGVHISFNYFFSSFHWNKRHVVVINSNKSHHYRSRRAISSGGYAKRWVHKPVHRKGVHYKSRVTRQKYHGNKVKAHNMRKSPQQVRTQLNPRFSKANHYSGKGNTKVIQARTHKRSHAVTKSNSAKVEQKNIQQQQINRSNHKVQKRAPKQRQESKNKERSSVSHVKSTRQSVGARQKHNTSIKVNRSQDSRAKH